MYVCHYFHGYADHLDRLTSCLTLVQGLGGRVPPVANAHLNYCFLPYGTVKTRCRWISHRPHTNMPKTDIWLATGYLVPDSEQQS